MCILLTMNGEAELELWEARLDDLARLLAKRGVEPMTARQRQRLAQELNHLADERDELADARDRIAQDRDADADERDVQAVARDRRERGLAADADRGFASRYLSARDRDDAASNRTDAGVDRSRAASARRDAAEARRRAADDYAAAADEHAAAAKASGLEIKQLRAKVDEPAVIGRAEGMLMERYAIDAEAAFTMLARLSEAANVDLRLVAEQLLSGDDLLA